MVKKCTLIILKGMNNAKEYREVETVMKGIQEKHTCVKAFSANILTSSLKVDYDENVCGPRDIIEWLEDDGQVIAEMQIKSDDSADIRKIAQKEVEKYKKKVMICVALYVPLLIFIWVVPFIPGLDDFMIVMNIWKGNSAYVLLCLIFASLIQFYLGRQFYVSAWKSVKHKSANMDVLIVIGTTAAYGYGIILILTGFPEQLVYH